MAPARELRARQNSDLELWKRLFFRVLGCECRGTGAAVEGSTSRDFPEGFR